MLSLKTRAGALLASCAVAILFSVPAIGQALWCDDKAVSSDGGTVQVTAHASFSSSPQTVSVSYGTEGPAYSGPSSVVIPAGVTTYSFPVSVGAGNVDDTVTVVMQGSTVYGGTTIWLE